jgi:hypothetical protein
MRVSRGTMHLPPNNALQRTVEVPKCGALRRFCYLAPSRAVSDVRAVAERGR